MTILCTIGIGEGETTTMLQMRLPAEAMTDPVHQSEFLEDAFRAAREEGCLPAGLHAGTVVVAGGLSSSPDARTVPFCLSPTPLAAGDLFLAVDSLGHVVLFEMDEMARPGTRQHPAQAIDHVCFVTVDPRNKRVVLGVSPPGEDRIDVDSLTIVHDGIARRTDGRYSMVGFVEPVTSPVDAFETLAFAGLVRHSPKTRDATLARRVEKFGSAMEGRLVAARRIDLLDSEGRQRSVAFEPPAIVEILAPLPDGITRRKPPVPTFRNGEFQPEFPVRVVEDFGQIPEDLEFPTCLGPTFAHDGTIEEGDFLIEGEGLRVAGSSYAAHDVATMIANATKVSAPNPDSPWAFRP